MKLLATVGDYDTVINFILRSFISTRTVLQKPYIWWTFIKNYILTHYISASYTFIIHNGRTLDLITFKWKAIKTVILQGILSYHVDVDCIGCRPLCIVSHVSSTTGPFVGNYCMYTIHVQVYSSNQANTWAPDSRLPLTNRTLSGRTKRNIKMLSSLIWKEDCTFGGPQVFARSFTS